MGYVRPRATAAHGPLLVYHHALHAHVGLRTQHCARHSAAREPRSHLVFTCRLRISGARYSGVPQNDCAPDVVFDIPSLLKPKSVRRICPAEEVVHRGRNTVIDEEVKGGNREAGHAQTSERVGIQPSLPHGVGRGSERQGKRAPAYIQPWTRGNTTHCPYHGTSRATLNPSIFHPRLHFINGSTKNPTRTLDAPNRTLYQYNRRFRSRTLYRHLP